jgi:hypothetical protein
LDKAIIGLVGAASALALAGAAEAANVSANPWPVPPAQTFAELLDPIPQAVSRLSTQHGEGELTDAVGSVEDRPVQLAQYYHHHHHHHHHHWWPWRHRHHHHHHHHHHYY